MPRLLLLTALLAATLTDLPAQWEPGQVYREYHYLMPGSGEPFLRVGGRLGYEAQGRKYLELADSLDLTGAIRAEVSLEKVQSHEDSRNLRIAVNGNAPIGVPEPEQIPKPQTDYMYHTEITVPLPLEDLKPGRGNRFTLQLDTAQRWGWPQNVFYGLTFRVYYKDEPAPKIDYAYEAVPAESYLYLGAGAGAGVAADYILVGHDIDWSGRGVQDRKHWQTHRGRPHHIIGSSRDAAGRFPVRWNTTWLPDQESFGVQVRVQDATGRYHVSEVLDGLRLAPRPYRVKTYATAAPPDWATREGEFEQTLRVDEDVTTAAAYQLHWTSWSPCYSNGVFLNGHLVWDREGDCYVYATHSPEYEGLAVKYLEQGDNVIRTAKTPLFRGQMVHGMEVQWPGIQLKVRYE